VIEPTEAEFTAQVLALAALRGWRCFHARPARTAVGWRTAVQGNGAGGFPDLILIRGDSMLVVELKVKRGKATPDQLAWLDAFRAAGIFAAIWRPSDWPLIEMILEDGPVSVAGAGKDSDEDDG
jgi:hypothetical protein